MIMSIGAMTNWQFKITDNENFGIIANLPKYTTLHLTPPTLFETSALFLTNTLLSLIKLQLSPKPVTITFGRIVVKAPKSCPMTPIHAVFTGPGSLNALNASSSHLPTKFSQLPNLCTFVTPSPFNFLVVLAFHMLLLLLGHLHHPL